MSLALTPYKLPTPQPPTAEFVDYRLLGIPDDRDRSFRGS